MSSVTMRSFTPNGCGKSSVGAKIPVAGRVTVPSAAVPTTMHGDIDNRGSHAAGGGRKGRSNEQAPEGKRSVQKGTRPGPEETAAPPEGPAPIGRPPIQRKKERKAMRSAAQQAWQAEVERHRRPGEGLKPALRRASAARAGHGRPRGRHVDHRERRENPGGLLSSPLLLIAGAYGVYAYTQKKWPFAKKA